MCNLVPGVFSLALEKTLGTRLGDMLLKAWSFCTYAGVSALCVDHLSPVT